MEISRLNGYINQAIPYAWDDSESYYEFLGKLLNKVNELVTATNEYFSIDLENHVRDIIQEWYDGGQLATIISDVLGTELAQVQQGFISLSNSVNADISAIEQNVDNKLNALEIHVSDFGAIGDGVTDDREAFQTALNSLEEGMTLIIDKPVSYYRIVNAEHTLLSGTTIEKRANAIENNLLKSLKTSTSNITIKIRGDVKATSLLDNLLELTGENVTIIGEGGKIYGNGEFFDNNPQPSDITKQWYSSLIKTGHRACLKKVNIINPSTVGIHLQGDFSAVDSCIIAGGTTTHGTGTVHFAIYGVGNNNIIRNTLVDVYNGKRVYTGVFILGDNYYIKNNKFSFLEHGIYSYGKNTVVEENYFDGTVSVASAVQIFNVRAVIKNNVMDNSAMGSVALQECAEAQVVGNIITGNENLISVRRYTGSEMPLDNINISDNIIKVTGVTVGSAISLSGDINAKYVNITNNKIYNPKGNLSPALHSGILIFANVGRIQTGFNISDNRIYNGGGQAMLLVNLQNSIVKNNYIIDANQSALTRAVEVRTSCKNILFSNNVIEDTRTPTITTLGFYEEGASGKNVYLNNVFKKITTPISYDPVNGSQIIDSITIT